MNVDPYQPPKSELVSVVEEKQFQFYVVSIKKFTVLFFATLGLYSIYWFYKNWKEFKLYNNANIWPVARGMFNIFFAHKLFSEIQSALKKRDILFDWAPNALAIAYVALSIVGNILDRMSMKEIGSPYTDLLGILILLLIYLTLLKPQKAINLSQDDIEGASNRTYTVANVAWISLGLLLWAISAFGLLIMFGIVDME